MIMDKSLHLSVNNSNNRNHNDRYRAPNAYHVPAFYVLTHLIFTVILWDVVIIFTDAETEA